MGYKNLQTCINDLHQNQQLIYFEEEIDPYLEASAIQRRMFQAKGPAILFTKVKNSRFPMLANLYGTIDRCHYIFRDTLDSIQTLTQLKNQFSFKWQQLWKMRKLPMALLSTLPKQTSTGPILSHACTLSDLPLQQSWPQDGGAYITLPQVYTEDVKNYGWKHSNLGMYRIQLTGKSYDTNHIGLHYQIHRGIGVHQSKAKAFGKKLPVHIYVGGAPAMTLAAIMPLPEAMPELCFAGILGGHRIPLISGLETLPLYAEADFCIVGHILENELRPEGPFGDHLGYYSLEHLYPVLKIEKILHRPNAIWPFTTVGRPPQEDTIFGTFIHELTQELIPEVLKGVQEVHAVDAAGVHPLLLAIGSERYTPYLEEQAPMELLTQANAILGQGQLSLAKYLLIAAKQDQDQLSTHHIADFFKHILVRIDFTRDLHFQTCTTMDSLDYSTTQINHGSKVVLAAHGKVIRSLPDYFPLHFQIPEKFSNPQIIMNGILAIEFSKFSEDYSSETKKLQNVLDQLTLQHPLNLFPLIIICDDATFTAKNLDNFLWVTFTKSNPSHDIYGIESFTQNKHWGCKGSLIIDARSKPHHAPVLEPDPIIEKKVDKYFKIGSVLHQYA